jgi:F420H(2)-dependent quinone reductase
MGTEMTSVKPATSKRAPRTPPRWVVRTIWLLHRALYSMTGGKLGLRKATEGHWGMLRLITVGRRTGAERRSILGYLEDGPNLVTLAMNGWADPEPAWWLNLQVHPDTQVDTVDGPRLVRARAAIGEERARLWERFGGGLWGDDLETFAARRSRETAVVVFESRD